MPKIPGINGLLRLARPAARPVSRHAVISLACAHTWPPSNDVSTRWARAGGCAREHRGAHTGRGVLRCEVVGDRRTNWRRRFVIGTGCADQPADSLPGEIVAGARGVGTLGPEGRTGRVNDPRVARGQR